MLDLAPLQGRGPEDQKFLLAGLLQEVVDSPVILVGGSLVQLYCLGAVTSLDLDIVADRRQVAHALEQAGFREGPLSMWRHPDISPLVNIVGADIGPSETTQTVTFEGHSFQAVTPEDCLVDRLASAKHWNDRLDHERCIILARTLHGMLDMKRLAQRAGEEGVADLLAQTLHAASQ